MAGENLDLTNEPPEPSSRTDTNSESKSPASNEPDARTAKGGADERNGRLFLGIHFACCSVYSRIYLSRDGTVYQGNCPRCAKQVRFRVGPGGSDARFYTAY